MWLRELVRLQALFAITATKINQTVPIQNIRCIFDDGHMHEFKHNANSMVSGAFVYMFRQPANKCAAISK